ncbi:hypothetical protein QBC33DRAFT_454978 [Phialemonium atrogriseum]|uniref:BTB domain-containing protein n=1 Tax=Phialemonium atrogriseum TaxID=1093897 RepID=A0AAJ0FJN4_9PEZI|nr:uncharacterized protein QBC33DRAFT_454978 [Phialemonium atrogriseum]KAK1765538.1 hypothetical protein QBC33DRAFT_454978 [Phialemonium atrogriseum]
MASQSDPNATSLALRGPASVIGGGSHSRHLHHTHSRAASSHISSRSRRYNRSHAGGGAYTPQNEFPVFSHSGDVEILVKVASGHENRYLLHRHTLTRCSGFFEASTSHEWSRAQQLPGHSPPATAGAIEGGPANNDDRDNQLARLGDGRKHSSDGEDRPSPPAAGFPKRRWRYELDPGTGEGDIPMLVQKEESSSSAYTAAAGLTPSSSIFGGPPPVSTSRTKSSSAAYSPHSFFRSVANLSLIPSSHNQHSLPPPTHAEQDLLRDYDNLFRIMYNYPPILDGINIADAYVQCKSLLTLADQYDALAVAGPRVDHHLLQFQGQLWKQIAKYPISYLRLGYLARSKIIFQEALIHVVGQWPAGERSLRAALPESVLDLIEDKVDELEETVSRVEARLFRLALTTRSGERVSPATGYLDWLALSLFRQWLADNTAAPSAAGPAAAPERRFGAANGNGNSGGGRSGRHPPSAPWSASASAGVLLSPLASLGRTYRTLGSGSGAGYLGHDECKRFLKLTPDLYSRDNLRRFEKRVDELKAMAREVVRPLTGSRLELLESAPAGGGGGGGGAGDARGLADGIGYLTCTTIGDRDLPWMIYQ